VLLITENWLMAKRPICLSDQLGGDANSARLTRIRNVVPPRNGKVHCRGWELIFFCSFGLARVYQGIQVKVFLSKVTICSLFLACTHIIAQLHVNWNQQHKFERNGVIAAQTCQLGNRTKEKKIAQRNA